MSWWTWWQIAESELGPAREPMPAGLDEGAPPAIPFRIGVPSGPAPLLTTLPDVAGAGPSLGIVPGAQPVGRQDRPERDLPGPEWTRPDAGEAAPSGQAPDIVRQVGNFLGDLLNKAIRTAAAIVGGPTFGAAAASFVPQPFRPTPPPVVTPPPPPPAPVVTPPPPQPATRRERDGDGKARTPAERTRTAESRGGLGAREKDYGHETDIAGPERSDRTQGGTVGGTGYGW